MARTAETTSFPRLVDKRTAATIIGVSLSTFERLRRKAQGPQCIRVSARRVMFDLAVLERWVASRAEHKRTRSRD